jgi:hypothetical protein
MAKLCEKCIKDIGLREFISKRGRKIQKCNICRSETSRAMDCRSPDLKNFFKALIRFHFSEWDYNPHFGGTDFSSLFAKENPILNCKKDYDLDTLEEAVWELTTPAYEKYSEGISLFAGYSDKGQNPLLVAVKKDDSSFINYIENKIRRKNYFFIEAYIKKKINDILPGRKISIPANTIYFRSRIGYEEKLLCEGSDGWSSEIKYRPWETANIGAPLPANAVPGRMNRDAISFLYLSDKSRTAISEVRPVPGQIVTVAKFTSVKDLVVADFRNGKGEEIVKYYKSDKELDKFILIKNICNLFNSPVIPEQKERYILTQLIADSIRKLKYDGIMSESTVEKGANLTIFDPDNFEYLKNSSGCLIIRKITLGYNRVKINRKEEDQFPRQKYGDDGWEY